MTQPHVTTVLVVAIQLVVVPASWGRTGAELERMLLAASAGGNYAPATTAELIRCEQLFLRTLRTPDDPVLAEEWREFGWQLQRLQDHQRRLWVVSELPANRRGWGFYVIQEGHPPGLVLQAPHSFADKYTRNVALRLFQDGDFAAAAWNTVSRKVVDVAHTDEHPYSAFTRALVIAYPTAYVAQIHGFAQEKRQTMTAATADLIVSNGDPFPDKWVRKTVVLMQSEFALGRVQLYPSEVQELGATQNVQGEILRQSGSERFIHFEMSQPLRMRIVADPRTRQAFLKNLAGAVD